MSKWKRISLYTAFCGQFGIIAREKQLKAGNRKRKEALINSINPEWKDLYDELTFE